MIGIRLGVNIINLRLGIIWYVVTLGLVSIFYAVNVDRFLAGSIVQILFLGFALTPWLVDGGNKEKLGLVKIRWWIGLLSFIVGAAISFLYSWLTGGDLSVPQFDVRLLYIVVLAPICEELFFRGYLQPATQSRGKNWVGLLIVALLFTAVHLPKLFILQEGSPLDLIIIFVLAVILGIIRYTTRSVYNSILLHLANNLISIFFIVPQY